MPARLGPTINQINLAKYVSLFSGRMSGRFFIVIYKGEANTEKVPDCFYEGCGEESTCRANTDGRTIAVTL